MRWPHKKQAAGFTLMELLVVIALIGILIALLLPAVQKIREASYRMKCQDHLKQYGLALLNYHSANDRFPPGGWTGGQVVSGDDRGGWQFYLLPYLEQGNIYQLVPDPANTPNSVGSAWAAKTIKVRLPYARCPSDDYLPDSFLGSNYLGSMGPQCMPVNCPSYNPYNQYCNGSTFTPSAGYGTSPSDGETTDPTKLRGMFCRRGARVRLEDVTDGTSNTLLVGETLVASHGDIKEANDWSSWFGNSTASTITPLNVKTDVDDNPPCSQSEQRSIHNWAVALSFKSNHPNGVNFAFVDGSVHFLSQNINHRTYQLLGCRNDGQAVDLTEVP